MNKFWFVWNEYGEMPKVRHQTRTSAKEEAKRLASKFPSDRFIILESVGDYKIQDPCTYTAHELGCQHSETKIWEPHLAGARKCLTCGMVFNPNSSPNWFYEQRLK